MLRKLSVSKDLFYNKVKIQYLKKKSIKNKPSIAFKKLFSTEIPMQTALHSIQNDESMSFDSIRLIGPSPFGHATLSNF